MRKSRRAPWAAMETWSSWLAEVGVESVEQGLARCLFSLIRAAVVTSAIIRPEFSPGSGVRNGGRSKDKGRVDHQRDAALGDGADLGDGERDLVSGEGHRLGVKIAARDDLALGDQHQRIVGDRIGLDFQCLAGKAQQIESRAGDLRLAADAIGILHAGIAVAMAFTDHRALHHGAHGAATSIWPRWPRNA
jgi:hypothetical protein